MTQTAPTVAVAANALLGEGPVWLPAERKLAFVDILAPALIVSDPADGTFQAYPTPDLVGAAVPRQRGGFLLALRTGFYTLDPGGAVTRMLEAGTPGTRFNDGKCDRRGRFWAGTMAMDETPGQGVLYRLDPDGRCTVMDGGFSISNGLGWSPDDRRFYFTDSPARRIYAYDFDAETGVIANRRVFVQLPEGAGVPDGLAIDRDGFVWSAHWDGWRVTRYAPDGRVDRVIAMPAPRPTSCAFGGPDLSTLYVTSARTGLSAQQMTDAPLSGSVFAVQTDARGLPETPFAG